MEVEKAEEIPFEEIKKYISENCPYNGLCFLNDPKERCNYEIMDGTPCRYVPQLILDFKEKYKKR